MAVVKAISNQELAALANRLRLTLIRDRMEEMLTMAVDKKLGWGAKFGPEGSSIIGSPSGNPE